jgi:ADP-ribosylglycohydrolase
LNGGDRDTLGAMACAISGAYVGVEAIPPAWRDKLENRQAIEALAARLASMV